MLCRSIAYYHVASVKKCFKVVGMVGGEGWLKEEDYGKKAVFIKFLRFYS